MSEAAIVPQIKVLMIISSLNHLKHTAVFLSTPTCRLIKELLSVFHFKENILRLISIKVNEAKRCRLDSEGHICWHQMVLIGLD